MQCASRAWRVREYMRACRVREYMMAWHVREYAKIYAMIHANQINISSITRHDLYELLIGDLEFYSVG